MNSPEDKMEMNGDDYLTKHEESLSDKVFNDECNRKVLLQRDVKEFIKKLKEKDLQALFLTVVVFIVGMYIGIAFEDKNIDKAESYFSQSEISLMDITALNNLLDSGDISCDILKKSNFDFADKIYNEAKRLDEFEKWFLSRFYGDDDMTTEHYDEISNKISELKKQSEQKESGK